MNSKDIQELKRVIDSIKSKYEAEKDHVRWFNNNMPGVGQTVDYLTEPPYPKEIDSLTKIYNKLKEEL